MVGDTFNDIRFASAQRQAAAQAIARQNVAIQNVNAARAEAERHAAKGSFTTIPTQFGQTIARQNQIGYNAPSLTTYRGITPNGSVQQAMKPSMQTPPRANILLFTNAQSSRPFSSGTTTQRRII
jgi:hypothetical protein